MGLFAAWHLVDRSLPSDRLVKQPSSEAEHHAWRQLPGFGRDKHGQRMQPIPLQQWRCRVPLSWLLLNYGGCLAPMIAFVPFFMTPATLYFAGFFLLGLARVWSWRGAALGAWT